MSLSKGLLDSRKPLGVLSGMDPPNYGLRIPSVPGVGKREIE
jgi:hypothetical protein